MNKKSLVGLFAVSLLVGGHVFAVETAADKAARERRERMAATAPATAKPAAPATAKPAAPATAASTSSAADPVDKLIDDARQLMVNISNKLDKTPGAARTKWSNALDGARNLLVSK